MEKKNTILLTVIAVATLLVAVVGATFAYFTATATPNGTGAGVTDATTAKVSGVNVNYSPIEKDYKALEYPGGYAYTGIKVNLEKVDNTDSKNYTVSYKVDMAFKNETGTDLTWSLYRADSADEITNAKTCVVSNDKPEGATNNNAVYFAYNCTGTNDYGTLVESGTIAKGTNDETAVTIADTNEQSLRTDAATPAYYYLVVDYKDEGDQTTSDQGKNITARITGLSGVKQAVAS